MATELSQRALSKTRDISQRPQLVFKLDNHPTIYGVGTVKKFIRIGDEGLVIGDDWTIGGLSAYIDQLDAITLDGSSNTITQQMSQDQDGTSSVQSMQLSLNDIDGIITELITPGLSLPDILGQKGSLYLGYQETAWPQDFVKIISGVIDETSAGVTIVLNIAHPEAKKRGQILPKIKTKLTEDLKWKSGKFNYIYFNARKYIVGDVSIAFVSDVLSGSEYISVVGNNITIHIQAGVTEPSTVMDKLERSADARALIEYELDDAINDTPTIETCSAVALTALSTDTVINVESTSGLLLPHDNLKCYVRINDEIIEYTGLTATTITGCTRAALVSIDARSDGESHKKDESVESFYRIEGNAVEIALKALIGGGPEYYSSDILIKSIGDVEGLEIDNSIYFEGINMVDAYGVTIGDSVLIGGDDAPTNDGLYEIADIVVGEYGTYFIVDGSLIKKLATPATASLKSQWNTNTYGLGMGGDEVDVPKYTEIYDTYFSQLFNYDFYITDTITVNEWLDSEVLYPTGMFTLPRVGKISAGIISPPLGIDETPVLDSANTSNPESNRLVRSVNRFFYNNIAYAFNEDLLDDGRMLSGELIVNTDSKERIKVGNKTKIIEARGVRPTSDNLQAMELLRLKMLDRYKYGAERIKVRSFYGSTFNVDVGDVVQFGDASLNLPDTKTGTREFKPRLMEVISKSLTISDGNVSLDLLDTQYSNDSGRYGVISPSSVVASAVSNTEILITNSYGWDYPKQEKSKWTRFIGETLLVHNEDYSLAEETTLLGFDPNNSNLMLVEALSFTPLAGYIVDVVDYPDNADQDEARLYKGMFVFTNPSVDVVAGSVDQTHAHINLSDASKFLPGATVMLHTEDYSQESPEVKVDSVAGNIITLSGAVGFIPTSTHIIELIGFKDSGYPYRYV